METSTKTPLIPTRFRSKIAHTHSYPIGAEAISTALAGVPQFELLELTFSTTWAFQAAATKYSLLHVKYQKRGSLFSASNTMVARGDLEAKWSIHVCPVPRSQRHAVQSKLLVSGLSTVRTWLNANTSMSRGRNTLSLFYDEDTTTLTYEIEKNLEPERL